MNAGFRGVEAQPKCTEQGQAAEEVDSLHVCDRALAFRLVEMFGPRSGCRRSWQTSTTSKRVWIDSLTPTASSSGLRPCFRAFKKLRQEQCDAAHEVFYDEERADEPLGYRPWGHERQVLKLPTEV